MRVALCHDWLTGMRGGERVLESVAAVYPQAELYTLVHVRGATSPAIDALPITASGLSRLPGVSRHYRKLLPLFPWAVERLRVQPCDLLLSTSHAFAKGVRSPRGAPHLCYCFTPMRYVWDQIDAYLGRGLKRRLSAPLVRSLRRWDRETSGPERITAFAAISHTVAARIRKHYGRDARVIYPPVQTERFERERGLRGEFYLLVSGFVPYKRDALAIEAFRRLRRPLVVAGSGPLRRRLEARAPHNVHFTGRISDAQLARLYARCRALIYPQEEDFGIVAVEAQAAGRPVVALGRGGASETVVPLDATDADPTGVWFPEPTVESLCDAVLAFERRAAEFSEEAIRRHAARFGEKRFQGELQEWVASHA